MLKRKSFSEIAPKKRFLQEREVFQQKNNGNN
jgi:hypothetical protein